MRRDTVMRILVHAGALIPLAWLLFGAATGRLSVNPIQEVEQRTGRLALTFLTLSLWCTPATIITGWQRVIHWRRTLGLYAFGYAALHFTTFIGLDYGLNFRLLWADVSGKRYIFVGLTALLILTALAITSTDGWKRRLRRTWRRLHRLVYLAGGLVVVHYVWAVKSDIRLPLLWGAIIGLGLLVRLPPVRRRLIAWRSRRRQAAARQAPVPVVRG